MAKMYFKNLQININEELKRQLKTEAAKRGVTLSAMIEEILEKFIDATREKE